MAGYVTYKLDRGLPWQRKLVLKERFSHRQFRPENPRGWVKTGTNTKVQLSAEVDWEESVVISLTAEETWDLPEGELAFDVLATLRGFEEPVVRGTILVSTPDNVTPPEDIDAMELRFDQYTDFRRDFSWADENGDLLVVYGAYLRAVHADTGLEAFLLSWTDPVVPSHTSPGYLGPKTGVSMQLYISGDIRDTQTTNALAAGTYPYDLFVQDAAGDWTKLVKGNIVIEPSYTNPYD